MKIPKFLWLYSHFSLLIGSFDWVISSSISSSSLIFSLASSVLLPNLLLKFSFEFLHLSGAKPVYVLYLALYFFVEIFISISQACRISLWYFQFFFGNLHISIYLYNSYEFVSRDLVCSFDHAGPWFFMVFVNLCRHSHIWKKKAKKTSHLFQSFQTSFV